MDTTRLTTAAGLMIAILAVLPAAPSSAMPLVTPVLLPMIDPPPCCYAVAWPPRETGPTTAQSPLRTCRPRCI